MKKHILSNFIIIFLLILLDMGIKIIIEFFFMEKKILFFSGFLGFKPHLNTTQLSVFNNELNLGVDTDALILLNILLILIFPLFFYLMHRKDNMGKTFYLFLDFMVAACFCSLFDKVFWGGSLDYIYLLKRWIVDLKDIYLALGILCYLHAIIEVVIRQKASSAP